MRILVIGGTGFVGSQVIQQLQKLGHTILVIHRNPTREEPPEVRMIRCAGWTTTTRSLPSASL